MSCFYDMTPALSAVTAAYLDAFVDPDAAVKAMKAASKQATAWIESQVPPIPQSVIDATGVAKEALKDAGMSTAAWSEYQLALWNLSAKRVAAMEVPDIVVSPTGYTPAGGVFVPSARPLVGASGIANAGDLIRLEAGRIVASGSGGWKQNGRLATDPPVRVRGFCDPAHPELRSVIVQDRAVGGSTSFGLSSGEGNVELEDLDIEADDTAGILTAAGHLPHFVLKRVNIFGEGSAYDPNWNPTVKTKWGILHNQSANVYYEDVTVRSIWQEHGLGYHHNIKGDHTFVRCSSKHCGRTDTQFFNRMTEGPIGKGNIYYQDGRVDDVCLEDGGGGSAMTFAGGMPDTQITIRDRIVRLGCDPLLAVRQKNITGALVCYSSGYGTGRPDAAYPGGQKAIVLDGIDFEVGTVYPGEGSAVRPVVSLDHLQVATLAGGRIKVTRGPGTNPIALQIGTQAMGELRITGEWDVDGWVIYRTDAPYHSWSEFRSAHPELFVAPWV